MDERSQTALVAAAMRSVSSRFSYFLADLIMRQLLLREKLGLVDSGLIERPSLGRDSGRCLMRKSQRTLRHTKESVALTSQKNEKSERRLGHLRCRGCAVWHGV